MSKTLVTVRDVNQITDLWIDFNLASCREVVEYAQSKRMYIFDCGVPIKDDDTPLVAGDGNVMMTLFFTPHYRVAAASTDAERLKRHIDRIAKGKPTYKGKKQWRITKGRKIEGELIEVPEEGILSQYYDVRQEPYMTEKFRLLDDDGNIYCEGIATPDEDFGPLDDYGMGALGCTEIQYRVDGKWRAL